MQLPKEDWQALRRAAYERRGQASKAQKPRVQGVPCGIGFACNMAVRQSSGPLATCYHGYPCIIYKPSSNKH